MVGFNNLVLLAAALLPGIFGAPAKKQGQAAQIEAIAHSYIVTLKSTLSDSAIQNHLSWVHGIHSSNAASHGLAGVQKTYSINDFQGYAGSFDAGTIESIRNSPEVCYTTDNA